MQKHNDKYELKHTVKVIHIFVAVTVVPVTNEKAALQLGFGILCNFHIRVLALNSYQVLAKKSFIRLVM